MVVNLNRTGLLTVGAIDQSGVPRYGWLLTQLEADGERALLRDTHLVLPARRYVDTPARVDALHLANGDWGIVGEFHGGGTRILQYARLSGDIFDPPSNNTSHKEVEPELITEVSVALKPDESDPDPTSVMQCAPMISP